MSQRKLKLLKSRLRVLNKGSYGVLQGKTKAAWEKLCLKQIEALNNPSILTFEAMTAASKMWHELAAIEEQFYRHKSRIKWLKVGDQNISFFHKVAQGRASKNTIKKLQTNSRVQITDPAYLKAEALGYFKHFL